MQVKAFVLLPEMDVNTYLLWDEDSREALLIDPADIGGTVIDFIAAQGLNVTMIVNTHGHGDHIGGNRFFKEQLHAPLAIHTEDAEMLADPRKNLSAFMHFTVSSPDADRLLEHDDRLSLGTHEVRVIHTPGHTPGGICLLTDNHLISGDSLFQGSIGRTDFPGGDATLLENMIRSRLFVLPGETIVLPGHGPQTTIDREKHENPYVGSGRDDD